MKYRVLGKTGVSVSVVGVGAWQFGGEWGRDYAPSDVEAILHKARECGINLIDTAECYGDHVSDRRRLRDSWMQRPSASGSQRQGRGPRG